MNLNLISVHSSNKHFLFLRSSTSSSSGEADDPLTSFDSETGVGLSMHGAGAVWTSLNSIDSTEEHRKVRRVQGAIELDGMILSMQSVVNDRKRVRRLCRKQQLMALR